MNKVNTFLPWFPLKSMAEAKYFFNERYASVYKQLQGLVGLQVSVLVLKQSKEWMMKIRF